MADPQTAQLTVLPDPKSPGTQQSIEAQVKFLREVLGEIDDVAKMGNALESMRKQSQDLIAIQALIRARKRPSNRAVRVRRAITAHITWIPAMSR